MLSAIAAEATLSITTYDTTHLPYQREVTISAGEDTANAGPGNESMDFNVGGWSWEDLRTTANPNRGWGHTSDWILLDLTEDAYVTFYQTLDASDLGAENIAPGFTVYSGEKTTGDFSAGHSYNNNGKEMSLNDAWDPTDELSYFTSYFSTLAEDISWSVYMPAGLYTIAIGNRADSDLAPTAVDYNFRIVTTAVPEPTTYALIGGLLSLLFVAVRRRRMQ